MKREEINFEAKPHKLLKRLEFISRNSVVKKVLVCTWPCVVTVEIEPLNSLPGKFEMIFVENWTV